MIVGISLMVGNKKVESDDDTGEGGMVQYLQSVMLHVVGNS